MTTTSVRLPSPAVVRLFGIVIAASAVFGTWAGLSRMGITASGPAVTLHGPLMVFGFLGTAIAVERAVGLRVWWGWLAPTLSAGAATLFLLDRPRAGAVLLCLAGVILVAMYLKAIALTSAEPHLVVMGLGAAAWLIAGMGLLSGDWIFETLPAMAGFLVLTVAGERVELSRMGPWARGKQIPWLLTASTVAVVGGALSAFGWTPGSRVVGCAFVVVALTAWLGDIARRTIRNDGLTRFMAAAILTGYVWLVVAGLYWTFAPLVPGTAAYDVSIHAMFIGFVLSMVLAHAAVIVPAVFHVDLPYHRSWWIPLLLLDGSLVARVIGRYVSVDLYRIGGIGTAVALVMFIVLAAWSAFVSRRHRLVAR